MNRCMNPAEVTALLRQRGTLVENWLQTCLPDTLRERLRAAMNYSLLAGGKRLRPVICLSTAALFGLSAHPVLPFAAALEMIHTYSLIHDDLPAMDDDDLRRGKPSCHKAFDEATAILAGDALLTDAFGFMASVSRPASGLDMSAPEQSGIPADRVLCALAHVAAAAGASGMVGGQILDMECTGAKATSLPTLQQLHALKTGALFRVACVSGGLLAGASTAECGALKDYGEALGAAFQIVDDILDTTGDTATLGKPVGSDADRGKTTYPSLIGLDRSHELAHELTQRAVDSLDRFDGPEAAFLRGLAILLGERKK